MGLTIPLFSLTIESINMAAKDRTFFLLPGFKTQIKDQSYKRLVAFLRGKGLVVVPVPIHWQNRTLSQNAQEFVSFYHAHKSKENYILGFSFGAVIALMTANETKPQGLYLCSTSPIFAEDLASMPSWLKRYMGTRRLAHAASISYKKLSKNIKARSVVFFGEREAAEMPSIKLRSMAIARSIKGSRVVVATGASHAINSSEYLAAIMSEVWEDLDL